MCVVELVMCRRAFRACTQQSRVYLCRSETHTRPTFCIFKHKTLVFFYLCVGYWRSGRSGRGEWFTVGDLDRSQRIYAVKINLRKLKFTCEGRGSSLHYA